MPPGLDLNININQRDGSGRDAGNAAGLGDGARADALQLLLHLARQAADRGVVEPVRDAALLGLLQSLDGALLLLEVAGVFDLGLDGFEFVADSGTYYRRGRRGRRGFEASVIPSERKARAEGPLPRSPTVFRGFGTPRFLASLGMTEGRFFLLKCRVSLSN